MQILEITAAGPDSAANFGLGARCGRARAGIAGPFGCGSSIEGLVGIPPLPPRLGGIALALCSRTHAPSSRESSFYFPFPLPVTKPTRVITMVQRLSSNEDAVPKA